jgi:signal peptidase I
LKATGAALFTLFLLAALGSFLLSRYPQVLGGQLRMVVISGISMKPHLHSGDVVLIRKRTRYRPGDVVAYEIPAGSPGAGHTVIHRVLERLPDGSFVTKGDNVSAPDFWQPHSSWILGRQWLTIPRIGYGFAYARTAPALAAIFALFVVYVLAGYTRPEEEDSDGGAAPPARAEDRLSSYRSSIAHERPSR